MCSRLLQFLTPEEYSFINNIQQGPVPVSQGRGEQLVTDSSVENTLATGDTVDSGRLVTAADTWTSSLTAATDISRSSPQPVTRERQENCPLSLKRKLEETEVISDKSKYMEATRTFEEVNRSALKSKYVYLKYCKISGCSVCVAKTVSQ